MNIFIPEVNLFRHLSTYFANTWDIAPKKAMAPHSSTVAWKIPWMEEPVRLWSMGSLSQTWLNDFTFTFHLHALEKEMAKPT